MIKFWIGIFCLTFLWICERSQNLSIQDQNPMVEEIQLALQTQSESTYVQVDKSFACEIVDNATQPLNSELILQVKP